MAAAWKKTLKTRSFKIMAKLKKSLTGDNMIESRPKKTRQGAGQHTKYAATSSNNARKRYRGQGKS